MTRLTDPCPGGCEHTDAEHRAFDRGVADGRTGNTTCPYRNAALVEDWQCGRSLGKLQRRGNES